MTTASQARDAIRSAVKDAGGAYAVAEAAQTHVTQLYRFLRGAGLEAATAGRLRAVLPAVTAQTWADAFAPMPDPWSDAAEDHESMDLDDDEPWLRV